MRFCTSSFSKNKILFKDNFVFYSTKNIKFQDHMMNMINPNIQPSRQPPSSLQNQMVLLWFGPITKVCEKRHTSPLFQRTKMIHNTKISCKANQILFQITKMIHNTHTNLAKQTKFCSRNINDLQQHKSCKANQVLFQRTKMIRNTQISVVNCKS
jgi:hypothetical protein